MIKLFGVAGFIVIVLLLIAAGPLLAIWALNTLFPALAIPYTFWTWLAALIITSIFSSNGPKITKSN